MRQILLIVVAVVIILASLSTTWYYLSFLPNQKKVEIQLQEKQAGLEEAQLNETLQSNCRIAAMEEIKRQRDLKKSDPFEIKFYYNQETKKCILSYVVIFTNIEGTTYSQMSINDVYNNHVLYLYFVKYVSKTQSVDMTGSMEEYKENYNKYFDEKLK